MDGKALTRELSHTETALARAPPHQYATFRSTIPVWTRFGSKRKYRFAVEREVGAAGTDRDEIAG
jgi:hypothetical protein